MEKTNPTSAFIQKLVEALNEGREVRVRFDGGERIGPHSELLTILRSDKIKDREEFAESLHKLDKDGQKDALGLIFDDQLMSRKEAGLSKVLPSGEVIEPTTVVLVIVLTLIVTTALVITTQIVLRGPVEVTLKANIEKKPLSVKPEVWLHFKPAP